MDGRDERAGFGPADWLAWHVFKGLLHVRVGQGAPQKPLTPKDLANEMHLREDWYDNAKLRGRINNPAFEIKKFSSSEPGLINASITIAWQDPGHPQPAVRRVCFRHHQYAFYQRLYLRSGDTGKSRTEQEVPFRVYCLLGRQRHALVRRGLLHRRKNRPELPAGKVSGHATFIVPELRAGAEMEGRVLGDRAAGPHSPAVDLLVFQGRNAIKIIADGPCI